MMSKKRGAYLILLFLPFFGIQCSKAQQTEMSNDPQYTNDLINETSPYLLQHAHNPVQWHAWNSENLQVAQKLDKPLLISIGYSACHWCHVMEHESFEDTAVAKIMNEKFYCIKVDREERPDVDQVYMSAVQLITGSGGWPLNCFALPDGRPFHGGTYFRKDDWIRLLETVDREYAGNKNNLEQFAAKLTAGIVANDEIPTLAGFVNSPDNVLKQVDTAIIQWSSSFDHREGGPNRSPKFPLPNNYELLMRYAQQRGNGALSNHVELTLNKMAAGGLYDQIGGGFARYSVDALWKVPHFEKMLYDNAQLLSLYSNAYAHYGEEQYLRVVNQTATFIMDYMTSSDGAFYSAYDADSEGKEGKYYVWKEDELKRILGDDYPLAKAYYLIGNKAHWEHGNNILLRDVEDAEVMKDFALTREELFQRIDQINLKLLRARSKRVMPGLDDKCLTSWNAVMVTGLMDAYRVTNDQKWFDLALNNAQFLQTRQTNAEGKMWHSYKDGRSTIQGFLEDYAHTIQAYRALYEATFNESWIAEAEKLAGYVLQHFYDGDKGFFLFSEKKQKGLVHNSTEVLDNVMPSSNSVMCRNLLWLSKFTGKTAYREVALDMLKKVAPRFASYPSGYSNWMLAAMDLYDVHFELVAVGPKATATLQALGSEYFPNMLLAASDVASDGYLFADRFKSGELLYYVCRNNTCLKPVKSLAGALVIMKNEAIKKP